MCFQIVERCPFCHRISHKHEVDACVRYGKQGHTIQEKTVYNSDDCPEHFNYGIQEAGDAVVFPTNSAIQSLDEDWHDYGLDVRKQAESFQSESNSMATPRAPQQKSIAYSGRESFKATSTSEADKAPDTIAYGHVLTVDSNEIPRHHSSDATQYSTDSASSRLGSCSTPGSCSTAPSSRSSSLEPTSRNDSMDGGFVMDSLTDDPSIEDSIRPTMMAPQHLAALLDKSSSQKILLLDLRVSRQYRSSRILGALNLCIPVNSVKRPSFNAHEIANTFTNEAEKDEFTRWKECDAIVVYDASSSKTKDATCAVAMSEKFDFEGWDGRYFILQGGFSEFLRFFPNLVESRFVNESDGRNIGQDTDHWHQGRVMSSLQERRNRQNWTTTRAGGSSWGKSTETMPLEHTNDLKSEGQGPLQRHDITFGQRVTKATEPRRSYDPDSAMAGSEVRISQEHDRVIEATPEEKRGATNISGKEDGPGDNLKQSTFASQETQLHSTHQSLSDPVEDRRDPNSLPGALSNLSITELPQRQDESFGSTEPGDSGYESSVDAASRQMCPDFQAVEDGHWSLETWGALQPNISAKYRDVMGSHNPGAIELLARNSLPTVCVTCKTPKKVDKDLLRNLVTPLPVYIGQGRLRRSMPKVNDPDVNSSDDASDYDDWPSCHGQYAQRPVPGASIGVSEINALGDHAVSLGGYIQMVPPSRRDWHWYGLTCHHLLDLDGDNDTDSDAPKAQGRKRAIDTIGTPDDLFTNGNTGQSLDCLWVPCAQNPLQSPARTSIARQIYRLEGRRSYQNAFEDYGDLDSTNVQHEISRLNSCEKRFGRATFSSGLCIDSKYNVQMDWLLIGDIPLARRGSNYVGSLLNYKEGFGNSLRSPNNHFEQHVTAKHFGTLIFSCRRWKEDHGNRCGLLSRIHGIGSETGAGEGRLASYQVAIDLEGTGKPTFEWSFKPRCKLGTSGDSGTWLFTEDGKLLGMIWGFNDLTGMVYYTPIYMVLDHIKRVLQVEEIQVPDIQHETQHQIPNDRSYESPPLSRGTPSVTLVPNLS